MKNEIKPSIVLAYCDEYFVFIKSPMFTRLLKEYFYEYSLYCAKNTINHNIIENFIMAGLRLCCDYDQFKDEFKCMPIKFKLALLRFEPYVSRSDEDKVTHRIDQFYNQYDFIPRIFSKYCGWIDNYRYEPRRGIVIFKSCMYVISDDLSRVITCIAQEIKEMYLKSQRYIFGIGLVNKVKPLRQLLIDGSLGKLMRSIWWSNVIKRKKSQHKFRMINNNYVEFDCYDIMRVINILLVNYNTLIRDQYVNKMNRLHAVKIARQKSERDNVPTKKLIGTIKYIGKGKPLKVEDNEYGYDIDV